MSQSHTLDLSALAENLRPTGLNLFTAFPVADLADSMPDFEIPAGYNQLLLVGSAGTQLWDAMPRHYLAKSHPVDEYSIDCINHNIGQQLPEGKWLTLFPHLADSTAPLGVPVPLQKLGALAGWHQPSPLGIGINATNGLWFAYRSVVVVEAEVGTTASGAAGLVPLLESPCLTCETTPCLTHCPPGALAIDRNPDLTVCVSHRLAEGSSCASTCAARMACPVGQAFQYSPSQNAYFYNRSRDSVKRWIQKNE